MTTIWTDARAVPPRSIVVGWDGSRHAAPTLAWAVEQARGERRPVTVAHVVPLDTAGEVAVWPDASELHETGERIQAEAREQVAGIAPPIDVHVLVTTGEPRTVLARLARSAALMVLGSHGRGPVTSKVLGSVGVSVIADAACPVVVVRPRRDGAGQGGVLAAIDPGQESAPAVARFAFHEASVLRRPLTVVHAIDADASQAWVAHTRRQLSEVVGGMSEDHPDVACSVVVQRGTVAEVVADQAEGRDLTVIGSSPHVRGHRATTASRLVEHADHPIAVVPDRHPVVSSEQASPGRTGVVS